MRSSSPRRESTTGRRRPPERAPRHPPVGVRACSLLGVMMGRRRRGRWHADARARSWPLSWWRSSWPSSRCVAVRLLDDEPTAATPQDSASERCAGIRRYPLVDTRDSAPDAYPDADNTGVPPGTELAPYAGPCTITETVVLSAVDATGVCPAIVVQAAGVRIESSRVPRVESTATQVDPTFSVEVVDSEVVAGEWIGGAVWGSNLTVTPDRRHRVGSTACTAARAAWSRTRGCTTSSTRRGGGAQQRLHLQRRHRHGRAAQRPPLHPGAQRHGRGLHGRPLALRRLRTDRRRAGRGQPLQGQRLLGLLLRLRWRRPGQAVPRGHGRGLHRQRVRARCQRDVRRLRHRSPPSTRRPRATSGGTTPGTTAPRSCPSDGVPRRGVPSRDPCPRWSRRDEVPSRDPCPRWSRRDEVPSRDPPALVEEGRSPVRDPCPRWSRRDESRHETLARAGRGGTKSRHETRRERTPAWASTGQWAGRCRWSPVESNT